MDFVTHLLSLRKRSIMDAIIKDIIDDARPMVTKDMARRGYAKLGIMKKQIVQRCLPNISDHKLDDLHIYYFSGSTLTRCYCRASYQSILRGRNDTAGICCSYRAG